MDKKTGLYKKFEVVKISNQDQKPFAKKLVFVVAGDGDDFTHYINTRIGKTVRAPNEAQTENAWYVRLVSSTQLMGCRDYEVVLWRNYEWVFERDAEIVPRIRREFERKGAPSPI